MPGGARVNPHVGRSLEGRILRWCLARLRVRGCALGASAAFVVGGLLYSFGWAPIFQHESHWLTPGDLWITFNVAGQAVHGHISSVYTLHTFLIGRYWLVTAFPTFPGILVALAPVAAVTSVMHLTQDTPPFVNPFNHPQAWLVLWPFALLLATIPIFACDSLAERLGVRPGRRVLLALAEAIVLWQVVVFNGHPEDAVAVGILLYATLLAVDSRWNGVGWALGVALSFQPLVILAFPVLFGLAGIRKWRGLAARTAIVPVAVVIAPLITNFSATFDALVKQPGYPLANFTTPWTSLAPRLHIVGVYVVAAGPVRLVGILLSCAVGWRARAWRDQPNRLLWAIAFALALRCFTESVMAPYYLWPALAVAILASAPSPLWSFTLTFAAATFVTVSSQWDLAWLTWWLINILGLTAVLMLAFPIRPVGLPARDDQRVAQRPRPTSSAASGSGRNPRRGGQKRSKKRR